MTRHKPQPWPGSGLTVDEIDLLRSQALARGAAEFWTVAHAVADEFGVSVTQITSPAVGAEIVAARNMVSRIAHDRGFSYPQIGRWLNRHHTSIMHGVGNTRTEPPVMFRSCRSNEKARLV
jgi:chromosomal replication initiation ATPase DnaA